MGKVDVVQQIDENSFNGPANTTESWSFSSNSTMFVMMAIVLCGGIVVGFQKKFPFQYQSVYSKMVGSSGKIDSIAIEQYMQQGNDNEKDLNVASSPTKAHNSAETFLHSV